MGKPDFNQRFGKYLAALPDKDAYLKHIGLDGEEIPLTKEGLDKVQFAHLCAVPFENIDLFDYDIKVDFGIEEMFDKVITRHRGGYCFELNAIYMALLEAIGFEVYPIGVRIIMGRDGPPNAISHRASIIMFDGKRYFSDVGFGMTNAPGGAICVDDYGEQNIRGDIFTVEDRPYNHKMIVRHTESGPSNLFMFVPDPFNIPDFVTYNTVMAATGFRVKRIANLRTPGGSISVDGDIFRRTENEVRTETPIETAEEAFRILTEEFGMILSEPLGDIAVKVPPQV